MTRLEELRDQVYNLNEGRVADAVLELLAIEIERAKDDDETQFANSECERKRPPKPSLLPCPACGGEVKQTSSYVICMREECWMEGPRHDPTGEKWNALPRVNDDALVGRYRLGRDKERQRWIDAVRKCVVWPLDDHRKILAATTEAFAKEIFKRMGVTDEPN